MNIFFLDPNPIVAARWQHDRHVVKMILESCQLLSGAIHSDSLLQQIYESSAKSFPDPSLYKPTHLNHPSALWTRESTTNFNWLTVHLWGLIDEYKARFNRAHKCERLAYLFAAMVGGSNGGFFTGPKTQPHVVWNTGGDAEARTYFETRIRKEIFAEFPYLDYPPFCGPDKYRLDDSDPLNIVESYRSYYLGEKVQGNRWTQHDKLQLPDWLKPHATIHVPAAKPLRKRVFKLTPEFNIDRVPQRFKLQLKSTQSSDS